MLLRDRDGVAFCHLLDKRVQLVRREDLVPIGVNTRERRITVCLELFCVDELLKPQR